MSENGPVLPPEVYRRRRIVAVVALLAVILLLVAGVTSIVGMINNKKDATVASTANDLKVTVTPAKRTFAAGEQVSFHVTYTNSSKAPCAVGGEGANTGVDLNITSGSAQVYTRSLCTATTLPKAEVAAGAEGATDLAWDRKINVLGCSAASNAQKGSYWATATVNGVTSTKVNFVIQ